MSLILDANFLVSVERERRHGIAGIASEFLASHTSEELLTTFTVVGELAAGRSAASWSMWLQLWLTYRVLPWTLDIAWQYGELYRRLQSQGQLIGINDLWIAATALTHGLPIVTNNVREFRRVAGSIVISY